MYFHNCRFVCFRALGLRYINDIVDDDFDDDDDEKSVSAFPLFVCGLNVKDALNNVIDS